MKVSFENYKWNTLVLLLPIMKSCNNLLSSALNNILLNTSAIMVKRKGAMDLPILDL